MYFLQICRATGLVSIEPYTCMCCENGSYKNAPGVRSIHSPPSEASARLGRLRVKSGSRVRALNGDVLKKGQMVTTTVYRR